MTATGIEYLRSGETEAVVIVKAAPQASQRHGETVCCAGIDLHGKWVRLFPVSFRTLDQGQKFSRWDRIRFKWRLPKDEHRAESRRVDQNSIAIVGGLRKSDREYFLGGSIVTSLDHELASGRTLALLRARDLEFKVEKKSDIELQNELRRFELLHAQRDLFNTKTLIPYHPCPFSFKYRYKTDDGVREGTCQDWEIEATFFKWTHSYGEQGAIAKMQQVFGIDYPAKGVLLAMGTHSIYPDTWLINGIVRLDEVRQISLSLG